MSVPNDARKPAPDAHWIVYAFYPWDEYTQTEVRLESRVGGIGSSLVVWRGNLGLGRADLANRTPRDCAVMLGDELWRNFHQPDSAPDHDAPAVAVGAPLGATGGTVTNVPLPGL
jgi:hypothetical protein